MVEVDLIRNEVYNHNRSSISVNDDTVMREAAINWGDFKRLRGQELNCPQLTHQRYNIKAQFLLCVFVVNRSVGITNDLSVKLSE
ncbi:hypothetical protein DQQ10_06535 [Pseudochryseolinea flava]|uniref:Uncharacterized protein n=1 Tax=Pseudochryseolinea flava TaxID=2059302 RepID=A0A364Y7T5_9BACT|nr:hypothetical protein DQQ10_06535 [Pseudochryseolinea flava]